MYCCGYLKVPAGEMEMQPDIGCRGGEPGGRRGLPFNVAVTGGAPSRMESAGVMRPGHFRKVAGC